MGGVKAARPAKETSDPERWLDLHGDVLFAYAAARVRDRHTAEDLLQETLLAAIDASDRFRGDAQERTWLIGILRHKILDHHRAAARERMAAPDDPGTLPEDREFDDHDHWRSSPGAWPGTLSREEAAELREAIMRCASSLPPPLRDAFVLREMTGIPSDQVSQALGISATNLWTRMHRARILLRRCLEVHWLGCGTGEREEA